MEEVRRGLVLYDVPSQQQRRSLLRSDNLAACIRAALFLSCCSRSCLLAPVGAQQFRQPPPYRILVTNDDGVRAPGIAAVAQALQAIGTPIIVAPAENQTGKGHSIITTEPVFREDLTLPNGLPAIGLTATPASTVNIAIRNIVMPRPDLVVSGINTEYNLGLSTHVSGTVGAAREAAMHGIPAIAASMSGAAFPQDLVYAAEEVVWVARRVKQYGLPPNTFLNVNIPGDAGRRLQGLHDHAAGPVRTRHGELRRDEASRRAGRSTGTCTTNGRAHRSPKAPTSGRSRTARCR